MLFVWSALFPIPSTNCKVPCLLFAPLNRQLEGRDVIRMQDMKLDYIKHIEPLEGHTTSRAGMIGLRVSSSGSMPRPSLGVRAPRPHNPIGKEDLEVLRSCVKECVTFTQVKCRLSVADFALQDRHLFLEASSSYR